MKKFHPIRLIIFAIATIALAKFFEAGRLMSSEMTFEHIGLSVFSLFAFLFLLFMMGYWVYIEEKEKNNLKYKVGLYEWVYKLVIARSEATKQSHSVIRLLRRLFEPSRNDTEGVK